MVSIASLKDQSRVLIRAMNNTKYRFTAETAEIAKKTNDLKRLAFSAVKEQLFAFLSGL